MLRVVHKDQMTHSYTVLDTDDGVEETYSFRELKHICAKYNLAIVGFNDKRSPDDQRLSETTDSRYRNSLGMLQKSMK